MLLLVCRHGSLCHNGSPRMPASGGGGAAACMQTRETEWARGGPHALQGPVWPLDRDGYGARELGVSGVGVGAPSNASALDRTSRHQQVRILSGYQSPCISFHFNEDEVSMEVTNTRQLFGVTIYHVCVAIGSNARTHAIPADVTLE
jgi:hypothetical protein